MIVKLKIVSFVDTYTIHPKSLQSALLQLFLIAINLHLFKLCHFCMGDIWLFFLLPIIIIIIQIKDIALNENILDIARNLDSNSATASRPNRVESSWGVERTPWLSAS